MTNTTGEFQFDVFLSHSAKDKAVLRPLAVRLRRDRFPEITSTISANLKNRPCFRFRGALPHHNEIALGEFPRR